MASPSMLITVARLDDCQAETGPESQPGRLLHEPTPSRLSRPPQLGISMGSPNPRKLNDASLMITGAPMLMVNMMMTGAMILGRTCRTECCGAGAANCPAPPESSRSPLWR